MLLNSKVIPCTEQAIYLWKRFGKKTYSISLLCQYKES